MTKAVTQSEFARKTGYSRAYVSNLKTAGRLVLTAEGLVDVEASKARIAATAAMSRDDVARRWSINRGGTDSAEASGDPVAGHRFQNARASKEFYAAELSRIEFERQLGKLVEKADVEDAIEDCYGEFRQSLENLPHRLSPELVGKDLDAIRAMLKQEIFRSLEDMQRRLTERIEAAAETGHE